MYLSKIYWTIHWKEIYLTKLSSLVYIPVKLISNTNYALLSTFQCPLQTLGFSILFKFICKSCSWMKPCEGWGLVCENRMTVIPGSTNKLLNSLINGPSALHPRSTQHPEPSQMTSELSDFWSLVRFQQPQSIKLESQQELSTGSTLSFHHKLESCLVTYNNLFHRQFRNTYHFFSLKHFPDFEEEILKLERAEESPPVKWSGRGAVICILNNHLVQAGWGPHFERCWSEHSM